MTNRPYEEKKLKNLLLLVSVAFSIIFLCACTDEAENAAVMGVEFAWQLIDKGSSDNPQIRLTGVPPGTKRFLVSLVDLNLQGFDHGSGFVDNDGTGIIARGAVKGSYNGPEPPYPSVKHTYEITVKALDAKDAVIGIGKNAKQFLSWDEVKRE